MKTKTAVMTAAVSMFLAAAAVNAQDNTKDATEAARAQEARDMTPTQSGAPTKSMREEVPASEVAEAARDIKQIDTPASTQPPEKAMEQARRYREIARDGRAVNAAGKATWSDLDADGDGRVGQAEFDTFRTWWMTLDRNRDGYISESEYREQP